MATVTIDSGQFYSNFDPIRIKIRNRKKKIKKIWQFEKPSLSL